MNIYEFYQDTHTNTSAAFERCWKWAERRNTASSAGTKVIYFSRAHTITGTWLWTFAFTQSQVYCRQTKSIGMWNNHKWEILQLLLKAIKPWIPIILSFKFTFCTHFFQFSCDIIPVQMSAYSKHHSFFWIFKVMISAFKELQIILIVASPNCPSDLICFHCVLALCVNTHTHITHTYTPFWLLVCLLAS